MRKILYLTDLYYEAKGRQYHKEDLYITSKLKEHFDLVLCNPLNSKLSFRLLMNSIIIHKHFSSDITR